MDKFIIEKVINALLLGGMVFYIYSDIKKGSQSTFSALYGRLIEPAYKDDKGRVLWLAYPPGMPEQKQWFTRREDVPQYWVITEIRE